MKKTLSPQTATLMGALLISVSGSQAFAQNNSQMLHQRATAAMCANCHGTDGRTIDGSAIPSLVGMPKEYMIRQLDAFKNGKREATVMHQITKGLTAEQIEAVANYYASTKR